MRQPGSGRVTEAKHGLGQAQDVFAPYSLTLEYLCSATMQAGCAAGPDPQVPVGPLPLSAPGSVHPRNGREFPMSQV